MFDNDTQLMVSILQEVFQLAGSEERDPVRYVKRYVSEIKEVGQIFAYLGLAEPDTQSPLGWKPTHPLLDIIAKRAVRRPKPIDRIRYEEERLTISLLCDAAFGKNRRHHPLCALTLLSALGLTQEAKGGSLPTLHLLQLFAETYYDLPRQELSQRQLAIGGA